jgi:NSS family neurotransmitter:Na+ symporter
VIYALCVILLGFPVMVTEFFIGRHTKRNAAGAFKQMSPGTKWSFIGYNGVLASFLIL